MTRTRLNRKRTHDSFYGYAQRVRRYPVSFDATQRLNYYCPHNTVAEMGNNRELFDFDTFFRALHRSNVFRLLVPRDNCSSNCVVYEIRFEENRHSMIVDLIRGNRNAHRATRLY
jgi:hypothetical protein